MPQPSIEPCPVFIGDIDLTTEKRLSAKEAVRHALLRHADGSALHLSAFYRYVSPAGLRGVRLEAFRAGGATYTTEEAIHRFIRRQSGQPESVSAKPSPSYRKQQIARARATLAAAGI